MRKYYYFIIIISTLLSCSTMYLYSYTISVKRNGEAQIINKKDCIYKNKQCNNNNDNTNPNVLETGNQQIDAKVENVETNTKEEMDSSKFKSNEFKPEQIDNKKESENSSINTDSNANNVSIKYDSEIETQPVFKVKKDDIFSSMSIIDKERVFVIATKLSKTDYNKIVYLLKNDNNGSGVISSFQILKDKLSKKDYLKLKGIAGKYINMNVVDDN